MGGTRWLDLKSLYGRAMELSARGREAYVARLSQVSLTSQLRALLNGERCLKGFMEAPPFVNPTSAEPRRTEHALNPGDLLGSRYEVDRFIGAGGMGEVYRAYDRDLQQWVALKTLLCELASQPTLIARLRKEVQLARRVTHPNICRLYDMGRAAVGGREIIFFTMELLNGRPLTEIVLDRPSLDTAGQIANQIIAGLSAAHAAGIVHRDLKSGNVIVTPGPSEGVRAIITDFGLAREVETSISETVSLFGCHSVIGTPAYMAPGQLEGKAATTASDIYSLGVLLFELISGRLPIESNSPLVIGLRRLREPAPNVREYAPDAPATWVAAIRECLEREPNRRPKSASEVGRILGGEIQPGQLLLRRAALGAAVGTIAIAILGPAFRQKQTRGASPEARKHYELGEEFAKRRTKENLANAVSEYQSALRAEPAYADAWTGLADAYSAMANFNFIEPREGLDKARGAANRAVQLSPGSGRANGVLAYVVSIDARRWLQAESYFERAVTLNPHDPLIRLWFGSWLGKQGKAAAALSQLNAGIDQDPASFALHHQRAVEFFWAKRFAEFLAEAHEVARIQPYEASSYLILARAQEWSGTWDEALKSCQEAEKFGNTPTAMCGRGCVEAAAGNIRIANELATQVQGYWEKNPFETLQLAQLLSRLKGPREVLRVLQSGYERDDSTILAARSSPYLEKWRQEPGFRKFYGALGLTA